MNRKDKLSPRCRSAQQVGDAEDLEAVISEFLEATQADEIIFNCSIFDHEARLRSYEITSQVMQRIRLAESKQEM